MANEQESIRTLFARAKDLQARISALQSNTEEYQQNLHAALSTLHRCREQIQQVGLFSPNETEDDIASGDLPYLSVDYQLADLLTRSMATDRKSVLKKAQATYEDYLHRLDIYGIIVGDNKRLYKEYVDNRDRFTLLSQTDPSKRRETKIARYNQQKDLKLKLEHLRQNSSALQNDDAALRQLYHAEILFYLHQTFHALDLIAKELTIIDLAPSHPPPNPADLERDYRERHGERGEAYSDRLDPELSFTRRNGNSGPILNKAGKPLQPFTLLDNRQALRNGVFRPDHSLPTMTIDEYLAEERRRGGMIEGGGEPPVVEPNEDDLVAADQETIKAREWDEFKEANPRGSGNTINRG